MKKDYRYYEFGAFEKLVKLSQLLDETEELPLLCGQREEIRKRQNAIRRGKVCAVVAGEFKRGKSTFINALLGEEILPADICPATAVPNRIVYGEVPRSRIRYKDGAEKEIKIEELSKYVTKPAADQENTVSEIVDAVIEYPSIPGGECMELIDTPGLNDDRYMDSMTLSCMANADMLLLTLSPSSPFSETESRFLAGVIERGEAGRIIVVVTKIDELAAEEEREKLFSYLRNQILSKTEEKLMETHEAGDPVFNACQTLLGSVPMFGVCPPEALEALKRKNEQMYRESGIGRFKDSFLELVQSVYANRIRDAADAVLRISGEYESRLPQIAECFRKKREEAEESRKCFAEECYLMSEENTTDEIRRSLWQRVEAFLSDVPDEIGRQFIKCLSAIRVLDAGFIERELREQAVRSEVWLNSCISKELLPELRRILTENTAKWYRDILGRLKCMILSEKNGMEPAVGLVEKLVEQAPPFSAEFAGAAFAWNMNPVPGIEELLEPDLISRIRQAVNESVSMWGAEEKRLAGEVLKHAAEQVTGELEKIVLAFYQEKQKNIDLWEEEEQRIRSGTLARRLRMLREEGRSLKEELMGEAEEKKKEKGTDNHD